MERRDALECVNRAAKLHGLNEEDLQTLAELVPFVSRGAWTQERPEPTVSSESVERCYRARFEAAEARYGRMKAVLCASLEAQMRLKSKISGLQVLNEPSCDVFDQSARDFLLGNRSADESMRREMVRNMWDLVEELKRCKEENAKLAEFNRQLRGVPRTMELAQEEDEVAAADERSLLVEAELVSARKRISALDREVSQLSSKAFDDDERFRECEDVFDLILGRMHIENDCGGVHPRFHPVMTCSDPACQNYAQRLRNAVKQSVAEAYVRERSARLHGHFKYYVEPVERVRLEKDREIERLHFELKRLERAACTTSAEAEGIRLERLDVEIVQKRLEMDAVNRELKQLRAECKACLSERNGLRAALEGLREELQEAKRLIEDGNRVQDVVKAERAQLQQEAEAVRRIRDRIDRFMSGAMATIYNEKRVALERLERQVEVLEERKMELEQRIASYWDENEDGKEEDEIVGADTATADSVSRSVLKKPLSLSTYLKRNGRSVVWRNSRGGVSVLCKECESDVPLDELQQHAALNHGNVVMCPHNCGYFLAQRRSSDMAKHATSKACQERVLEIRRLNEEGF